MKGLIKNNVYAAGFSAKLLLIILAAAGIFIIAFGYSPPLISYSMFCIAGLSVNTIASYRKESASKWSTYQLTMPVTRKQIVQAKFICHVTWLTIGVAMVAACIGLTCLFHGNIFDTPTDIFSIFTVGISFGFLLGAFFYPLHYLGGDEHNEINLGISIVGAAGVFYGLAYFVNYIFGFDKMEVWQLVFSMLIVICVSAVLFIIAYIISLNIFYKKER